MTKHSISRRLTIGLAAVVLLLSGAGLWVNNAITLSDGRSQLEKQGREYADVIAEALRFPLWNLNAENIADTSRAYANNDLIVRLTIADSVGNTVFDYKAPQAYHVAIEQQKAIAYEGNAVGRLHLALTDHFLNENNRRQLWTGMLTMGITLFALLGLTSLLLQRFLKTPMERFRQITGRYAAGDYTVGPTDLHYTEFSDFITALHAMGDRIREQLERLNTSNARLSEAEAQYRGIFENAREGLFQLSKSGGIISANPAMKRILGYAESDAVDPAIDILSTHLFPDAERRDSIFTQMDAAEPMTGIEQECRRADRSVFWGELTIRRTGETDWEAAWYEGSLVDISERKNREKAEREREAAVLASEAKSMFVANMSHEIRTPLNAVIGMTALALKTELTPKQQDYLTKIDASSRNLLNIINDILDFSKIEAGRFTMERTPFELESVLEELSTIVGLKAEEKGLDFLFDIADEVPKGLVGDPLRLGQVLINLAGNAVKFTESGQVIVKVGTAAVEPPEGETALSFSVTDTGIGLTQEQIDSLFKAFSQADASTTRKYGGTGLGLAISKRIVEKMDGTLSVESTPGTGSTFRFTARFGTHDDISSPVSAPPSHWVGMRVLVVDDNSAAREIISEALEALSFDVTEAASAEEAIQEIENSVAGDPFKLVIMDWKMPGMDGIEATRHIKSNPNLSDIPAILMVTAYDRGEIRQMAEAAGNDAFLVKPVTPSLLMKTIAFVFGETGHERIAVRPSGGIVEADLDAIRGARILLVEDNEINQQVAVELLEHERFVVTVAGNGREALELLRKNPEKAYFDAILMDVQMSEMDGFAATEAILNLPPPARDIPIIAMTAHALQQERDRCFAVGMRDFISKPIDPPVLLQTLVKWIEPGQRHVPERRSSATDGNDTVEIPVCISHFDIDGGLARVGGNRKRYLDLLLKFRRRLVQAGDDIPTAIDAADANAVRRSAHTLKGMAGNLGIPALFEAASQLEQLADSGSVDRKHSAVAAFDEASQSVLASLQRLAEGGETKTGRSTAMAAMPQAETLMPLLSALKEQLASDYAGAMQSAGELDRLLAGTAVSDTCRELVQAIEEFEDETALACVETVARQLQKSLP